MKKTLLLLLIFPLLSYCQENIELIKPSHDSLISLKNLKDTLYTISGFKVYVGQKLKIGSGAMPDGDFKYIRKNANSLFNYYSTTGYQGLVNQANSFRRSASGLEYKVIRIDTRGNKKHGYVYYPIITDGTRYEIDIDNAIAFGEIVIPDELRPKAKPLLVEIKPTDNISIADELTKLKKLKDDGVITDEEFQIQKKKLLDK